MTREQIEELRRYHDEATAAVSCAGHDDGEWCEFCTALSKMATFAANNASALLAAARREGVLEGLRLAEKCVPTNWLDPLLTGPDAVLKKGHDNREIEALLRGVQDRVRAEIAKLKGES